MPRIFAVRSLGRAVAFTPMILGMFLGCAEVSDRAGSVTAEPVDPGVSEAWTDVVQASIAAGEYQPVVIGDQLVTTNRAHALHGRFDARGAWFTPRGGEDAAVGLSLRGWGREGALTPAGAAAPTLGGCVPDGASDALGACVRRVEYAHAGLVEWWENGRAGLEHGYTVEERPAGVGPLVFALTVTGAEATLDGDGTAALLHGGGVDLSYAGLVAVDDAGQALPAWMERDGDGLRLVVDDSEAEGAVHVDPLLTTVSWTGEGDQGSASFGYSASSAGDVNGDGYGDVIVGTYLYDNGQTDEGRAYVYLGAASGLSTTASWTAESNQATAYFAWSVSTAGDVNGDGYGDVIIGSPQYDNGQTDEGRVYVYLGSASGLGASAAWTVESDQASASFGGAVASAGDVNGDGYADVIIGANLYDNGQTDEGRASVYLGSASGLASTAVWTAESDQASASFGIAVGPAGDANGDGYGDVVVGASLYDNGQSDEGRALVYLGSASGLAVSAAWSVEPDQASANLGSAVSTAGDVNGDGYSDLLVGAFQYDNGQTDEGRAWLYLGSAGGPATSAAWTAESDQASANFGVALSGAGDVNGDGYADVVVGAHRYDNGQTDEGMAFLYLGSASGLATASSWTSESGQNNAFLGRMVSAAGDVNGDGYGDVIIAAPQLDNGAVDKGRATLFLGAGSGLGAASVWAVESDLAIGQMGASVAAGDVNGDGYADVVVGAPGYSNGSTGEGRAFLYLGASTGLAFVAAWTAESDQAGAAFGTAVAAAGDVNGDGYADVLIGAPAYDNGQTDEGRVYLYLGGAAGLATTPAWTSESDQASASYGEDLASAGDVNGDGYDDVVVGASRYDNGQTDEGRVWLYLGAAGGPGTAAAWSGEGDAATAWYGDSVAGAGDVNGDGFADVIVGCPGCMNGALLSGRALVYLGSGSGLPTTASWTAESTQSGSLYGSAVASAGDVNGDGYGDVMVGASNYNGGTGSQGRAFVYLGAASGPAAAASWTASTIQIGATLGYEVGSAGDVNGDGYGDVVVSAPGYDGTATDSGRVYVYLGASPGLLSSPAWTGDGGQVSTSYGTGVAAGDVNGDGFSDLMVGASAYENGATDEGRAQLYYGNGADNTGASAPQVPQARQPGTSTPIAAGLASTSTSSFDVAVGKGRSSWGRARIKLQVDVKPLGQAFDGGGRTTASTFTSTGLTGVTLQQTLSGFTTGTGYHWRARTLIAPAQGMKQGWSRWYYGGQAGDSRGGHLYTGGIVDLAPDADGDTYGSASLVVRTRTGPISGYISDHDDCDDGNAGIHPGAVEVCNGADDDCDATADELGAVGQAWYYLDADLDDWGAGSQVLTCPAANYVSVDGDCDDTNDEISPDAPEICDDLDDDCDGIIDPGTALDASLWYRDNDADGYGITRRSVLSCESPSGYADASNGTDCNDAASAVHPGATELCNDIDDDCDGGIDPATSADAVLWFRDRDGDGYGVTRRSAVGCEAPGGFVSNYADCNDASASVFPGADETCNAVDDNCDGNVDETGSAGLTAWYTDVDGDGYGGTSVTYACTHPPGTVPASGDCNDASSTIHPGATEACNGIDDDCTGVADDGAAGGVHTYYVDGDGDGYGGTTTIVDCVQPPGTVTTSTDCNDALSTVHPGADEACNGVDDDCSGAIDDGASGSVQTYYVDGDGDGYGDPATAVESCTPVPDDVLLGGDCDDGDEYVYPGAPELCDGQLNDCADSGSWVTSSENGAVSWTGTDGTWVDWTTPFTAGTSASVNAFTLPASGTMYVCDGTYYVSMTASSAGTLTLTGWNSASTAILSGANLSRVLSVTNSSTNLTVDGLTLKQGAAPGSDGGCVSVSAGTVSLTDAVVTSCSAMNGGGLYLGTGTVTVSNSDFTSNSATNGGAVFNLNGVLSMTDTDAISNTAAEAGAVYFNHGSFTLTRGTLSYNLATGAGGAIRANAAFTVTDSTMEGNDATNGGAIYYNATATLQLTNTLLIHNEATAQGGGVYVQVQGTLACTGTTAGTYGFIGNIAGTGGGGVFLLFSTATLRSTICDWGIGGSSNTLADIVYVTATFNKSNNQTFTCSAGTCP